MSSEPRFGLFMREAIIGPPSKKRRGNRIRQWLLRVVLPEQQNKSDAICVELEHENGETVDVFEPYQKKRLGRIQFGELFATEREPHFFRRLV
jgi:hypothetical protein